MTRVWFTSAETITVHADRQCWHVERMDLGNRDRWDIEVGEDDELPLGMEWCKDCGPGNRKVERGINRSIRRH